MRVVAVPSDAARVDPDRVRLEILEAACDLADAVAHAAVSLDVEVSTDTALARTPRGKLHPVIQLLDDSCGSPALERSP